MTILGRVVLLAIALLLAGCGGRAARPDLAAIYGGAAAEGGLRRNPLVVIPGLYGSRLEDDAGLVWGAFGGGAANPADPAGARRLAVPMRLGVPLDALRDGVRATRVIREFRASVLGVPVNREVYEGLLEALGAGGYRDPAAPDAAGHAPVFTFAYDWRRDLADAAVELGHFLDAREADVRALRREQFGEAAGEGPIEFDVVAHSMGGLVLRYYLRYGATPLADVPEAPTWAGAARVGKAVIVAAPNAGSVGAIETLAEGKRFAWILPHYPAAVTGTMPGLYQLLPRAWSEALLVDGEFADPAGSAAWAGRGLADPDQAAVWAALLPDVPEGGRAAVAREHQLKCLDAAKAFHAALDVPSEPPPGLRLALFAGDARATPAAVTFRGDGVDVVRTAPGDGAVTRASALGGEGPTLPPVRWGRVQFLTADHLGLTRDVEFVDNLLYLLLLEH